MSSIFTMSATTLHTTTVMSRPTGEDGPHSSGSSMTSFNRSP